MCICVCMYVCIYIYIYTHLYILYIYIYIICIYIYIVYIYIYICILLPTRRWPTPPGPSAPRTSTTSGYSTSWRSRPEHVCFPGLLSRALYWARYSLTNPYMGSEQIPTWAGYSLTRCRFTLCEFGTSHRCSRCTAAQTKLDDDSTGSRHLLW